MGRFASAPTTKPQSELEFGYGGEAGGGVYVAVGPTAGFRGRRQEQLQDVQPELFLQVLYVGQQRAIIRATAAVAAREEVN